jgi:hypothetical protein
MSGKVLVGKLEGKGIFGRPAGRLVKIILKWTLKK